MEYKVQLGVFGATQPGPKFLSMLNQFPDVAIIKDNLGLTHYVTGSDTNFRDALAARDMAKQAGAKEASIVAFNDGNYAPLIKKGVVYKVQLGVFRGSPDQKFMGMVKKFKEVDINKDNDGLTHYMVGPYNDLQGALAVRDKASDAGTKGAFIVALYNGNRIAIPDVLKLP